MENIIDKKIINIELMHNNVINAIDKIIITTADRHKCVISANSTNDIFNSHFNITYSQLDTIYNKIITNINSLLIDEHIDMINGDLYYIQYYHIKLSFLDGTNFNIDMKTILNKHEYGNIKIERIL